MTAAELAAIEHAARGKTSTWARGVLLKAAGKKKLLGEPGNRTQPGKSGSSGRA
jgi:hypothetical protein